MTPNLQIFLVCMILCLLALIIMIVLDGHKYPGPHADEPDAPLWHLPSWLRTAVNDPSKPLTLPYNPIEAEHLVAALGALAPQGD